MLKQKTSFILCRIILMFQHFNDFYILLIPKAIRKLYQVNARSVLKRMYTVYFYFYIHTYFFFLLVYSKQFNRLLFIFANNLIQLILHSILKL